MRGYVDAVIADMRATAGAAYPGIEKIAATTSQPATKASAVPTVSYSFKAEASQDEDGIIIGRVSVAGNFDRENERVLETALKAATWKLAMDGCQGVDINHEAETIGCDVVGVYYDYGVKACVVHLRPHDRAIYDAAKSGEIVGMSWTGPYTLQEAS